MTNDSNDNEDYLGKSCDALVCLLHSLHTFLIGGNIPKTHQNVKKDIETTTQQHALLVVTGSDV